MAEMSGKVAIVTGSSSGIGLATAQAIVAEGGQVVMNGRDPDRLAEALNSVPGAVGVPGDVGDPEVAEELVNAATGRFGRLDVAVANAASPMRPMAVTELDNGRWQRSLDMNLSGAFYLLRAAGRVMVDQGNGSVVVVGSIAGVRGLAGSVAYSAAKGGLIGLVAAAAKDLGPSAVRVNLVLPSAATAPALAGWGMEELADMTVLKRAGVPADCAQLILFLASDRSAFITGETINVDGGTNLKWGNGY